MPFFITISIDNITFYPSTSWVHTLSAEEDIKLDMFACSASLLVLTSED